MSNESAFLKTILDHPHDAGPRLVFADWLQEQGDSWGDFIAAQNELADGPIAQDYDDAYARHRKGDLCIFAGPTTRVIERCKDMLDKLDGDIVQRCLMNYWTGSVQSAAVKLCKFKPVDGDLVWWRVVEGVHQAEAVRVFFWRGFPERLMTTASQWVSFHAEHMGAFPLWHLTLTNNWRRQSNPDPNAREQLRVAEDALQTIIQYAGRITVLDLPKTIITNGFTAWTCRIMDEFGERCQEATGKPFTLKIGQPVMGGPLHSVQERWNRMAESWLKNSNVRVLTHLGPRPVGDQFRDWPHDERSGEAMDLTPREHMPSGTR